MEWTASVAPLRSGCALPAAPAVRKAKLVIHKAYGFRTAANYIRNLYHCLGDLPPPKIVHTFV